MPTPRLDHLTIAGRGSFLPDYDLVIYLAAGIIAVLCCSLLKLRNGQSAAVSQPLDPQSKTDRTAARVIDVLAVLLILALVVVISPEELAERTFYADRFHHVSFYLLGPLQAYRHGAALGSDTYTQYGSGWVILFCWLGHFISVDPVRVMGILPLFGAGYFLSVYGLLRLLTRSALWSLVGLMACLQFQLYSGTDAPLWGFPSSSVLRCPCDMAVAIALLFRSVSPRGSAIAAGSLAGLSLLFGTDTGVYLAAALVVFSILATVQSWPNPRWSDLAWLWGSYVAATTTGLLIASRGTLFESRFWMGYFESLLEYGGGFGALPISAMMTIPLYVLLLFLLLMVYTLTVSRVFAAAVRKTATDRDLVLATIAVVGFGTLILFINRSHPYNLFHPIVPACVLLTVYFADRFPATRAAATVGVWVFQRKMAALGVIGMTALLMINRHVWEYPSAASRSMGFAKWQPPPPHRRRLGDFMTLAAVVNAKLQQIETADNPVTIIGEDTTLWLMGMDRAPLGRYCPAILINQRQVQRMQAEFQNRRPKLTLVTHYPASYETIPSYFDSRWRCLFRCPEFSIYASPEYEGPEINFDLKRQEAALPSAASAAPRTGNIAGWPETLTTTLQFPRSQVKGGGL